MKRKFIGFLIAICIVLDAPVIASADEPIQLYVDDKEILGINPILKSGVMYVPYRNFFNALGYKVAFDQDTTDIWGFINGSEMVFQADDDLVDYNGYTYHLNKPIPVINGQVYFPVHFAGQILKYSVDYDEENQIISMKKYGHGQEAAVQDLLSKYYKFFSPKLLTFDNLKLGYYNPYYDYESNHHVSEIPVRDFVININSIEYSSANEATLQVTYIDHTEILNRQDEYVFEIRNERGQWKIADSSLLSVTMDLPKDINETAAKVMEEQYQEQSAVLLDLRTYFKALNDENLELTVQYRSPSFLKKWNAGKVDLETELTWENLMKLGYESDEWKYKLTGERVVFVGEKEAVVHGIIEWSDVLKGDMDVYEALIFLEYANGHWNYDDELELEKMDVREGDLLD